MTRTDPTPVILVDSREQAPLEIEGFVTERTGLPVGDYGIRGFSDWSNPRFIIERKSLPDLAQSLSHGRERFLREIEKMRQFGFRALLIEGTREDVLAGKHETGMTPTSILASLDALAVRCNLHVFWAGSAFGAARQLEGLVRQFVRGVEKDFARLQAAANAAETANAATAECLPV